MKNVSSHVLRLTGKAELPRAIEAGHNYHISLEGSVTGVSYDDNEDGTFTASYKFKPVKIDLLNPKGETLKLKDTRTKSQLFRARCWAIWKNDNGGESFDDFYGRLMDNLIQLAHEVVEMYRAAKGA